MSTREDWLPSELSLVSHAPTDVTSGATPPLVSPGVSSAAARSPTQPTVPDADPASLHLAGSRYGGGAPMNPFSSALDFSPLFPSASPSASSPSTPDLPGMTGLESFSVPLLRDDVPAIDAPHAPAARTAAAPGIDPQLVPSFESPGGVPALAARTGGTFDAHALKREFPILQERVHGRHHAEAARRHRAHQDLLRA
jgi:cysteine desulfurase/selenocysteine lyase